MLFHLFIMIAIFIVYNRAVDGIEGDDWAIYLFFCGSALIPFILLSVLATANAETMVVCNEKYELVPGINQQYVIKDDDNYLHMYYWDETGFVDKEIWHKSVKYNWNDTYVLEYKKTALKDKLLQALFFDMAGKSEYILNIPKEEYERIFMNEMFDSQGNQL